MVVAVIQQEFGCHLHISVGDLELGDVVSVVGDEWSWVVGRRDDLVEGVGAAVSEIEPFCELFEK